MQHILQPVLKHEFDMECVHYFLRRAKPQMLLHTIMNYNSYVHPYCHLKYPDLVICTNLNAIVLCLGGTGVIVTPYITFSTSQNCECNAIKSKLYHTV